MPIEEWLFRIGGAILLINLFALGLYFILRGYYKHKRLNSMRKVDGRVSSVDKRFRASVKWYWKGQEVHAIEPALFAFHRNSVIPLFISDTGMNFYLNIWTHNGKGLIVSGSLLCLTALFFTIILI